MNGLMARLRAGAGRVAGAIRNRLGGGRARPAAAPVARAGRSY